jgi:hypothetical protein
MQRFVEVYWRGFEIIRFFLDADLAAVHFVYEGAGGGYRGSAEPQPACQWNKSALKVVLSVRPRHGVGPSPVFLQMFILKGFKFNVLEVLIPESLQACFWKWGFQRISELAKKIEPKGPSQSPTRKTDVWGTPANSKAKSKLTAKLAGHSSVAVPGHNYEYGN